MPRFILPLFLAFFIVQSLSAQDCNTLLVTAAVTSNYNGSPISCNEASDGIITVIATGGATPYTFTFDQFPANLSGTTTGVFTNIPAGGPYTFTVRDVNNCIRTTMPLMAVQPPALVVFGDAITNYNGFDISCTGNSNGALAAIASGGLGQYQYQLTRNGSESLNTSGAFTGIFNALNAATYTVSVRDQNFCLSVSAPIVMTEPTVITANTTFNNGTPENCSDASIIVAASGGTGAFYTYKLGDNTTGEMSGTFTGLTNGSYSVEVRDLNGCVRLADPVEIDQPNNLSLNPIITNVSCFGDADGQNAATASGGSGYMFLLLEDQTNVTGITSGVFTDLTAGAYTIWVRDQNQCETTSPVEIASPAQITANIAISSDYNDAHISCTGEQDGMITVQASGGTGMFLYKLNGTGVQTNSGAVVFTSLAAGDYQATAEDANGCEITTSTVTLTQPERLTVESTITNNGHNKGSIELTVEGGTAPYSFAWSNESTQEDLINAASGDYTVDITDANDCLLTESFNIPLFVGVPEENETSIQVLYDSYSGKPYLSCLLNTVADVSIHLFDLKGSTSYSVSNRQQAGLQHYNLSPQLQPGLYIARVRINEKTYAKKFIVF
jgi:hypothetical protein